jgi:hypothetical protein
VAAECVINVNGMTKELWLSVAVVAASAIATRVSRTGKPTVPAICCMPKYIRDRDSVEC